MAEIEVRRSRFRCTVERVADEASARAVVDLARSEHWDARHHCSAFVLGPEGRVQRSNDDGEPAGTAGAPMLRALNAAGVSDVVAVVTRWFGGVLLGTGGLTRAYGDAVRAGLQAAGTVERVLVEEFELSLEHADAGRVEGELRTRGVSVLSRRYAELATLRIGVPHEHADGLPALVAGLTAGAGVPVSVGQGWVDSPPPEPDAPA